MATTVETTTHQTPSVLPPHEARALFDRQARHLLNLSGEEFLARWDAGEFRDLPDSPEGRLALFLLARSLRAGRALDRYFTDAEDRVSRLEDGHADALLSLAHRLSKDGDTERALDRYRQLLALYPGSPQARDAGKVLDEHDRTPRNAD